MAASDRGERMTAGSMLDIVGQIASANDKSRLTRLERDWSDGKKICSVEGCDKPRKFPKEGSARQWPYPYCGEHYNEKIRNSPSRRARRETKID